MPTDTFYYPSLVGTIVATASGDALTTLRFADIEPLQSQTASVVNPLHDEVCRWLDVYFAGQCPTFTPKLNPCGTIFQQTVWRTLLETPYGQTTTYGQVAQKVGCRSAQAVGQAIGRNPIALIVPCHRVVGSGGELTGYAYGIERKKALLHIERTGAQQGGMQEAPKYSGSFHPLAHPDLNTI